MKKIAIYFIALLATFTMQACTDIDDKDQTLLENENYSDENTSDKVDLNDSEINLIKNITMKTNVEKGDQIATITTNKGDIKMFFYPDLAPETVKNFTELAKAKKYDGVIFHRVINDFMIQTGDFENNDGTGGYSYKGEGTIITDEFGAGLKNTRGAVSMANRGPNTGGSQFFIVQAKDGADWLNGKHAVFAFVYEGMDIVDEIATAEKNLSDRPLEDIVMESVEISNY